MRGDLDQLRILLAVARDGSFTAAAAERNVEVSAISRAIRDLELTIGAALFERLPRGVQLTDAGRSYVESAREILERHERAGREARQASSGKPLHLALGFAWSATCRPMVELLRSFAVDFPMVAVEVLEVGTHELASRLRTNRLDIVIVATEPRPLPRFKSSPPLETMLLWTEPLFVVLPITKDAAQMTWTELAAGRLLCRTIDDWQHFARHVEFLGGPKLDFESHAVSQDSLLGLVEAGLGWTLIPESLGQTLSAGVRKVPITSAGATIQAEALWRVENANPALNRFLALCRQLYGPAPDDAL